MTQKTSKFGPVPPSEEELIEGFLGTKNYIITGPRYWNALGLGTTRMFVSVIVYNTIYDEDVTLDNICFLFRKVLFPTNPTVEWYTVDLFNNYQWAGISLRELTNNLRYALKQRPEFWKRHVLYAMAEYYGEICYTKTGNALEEIKPVVKYNVAEIIQNLLDDGIQEINSQEKGCEYFIEGKPSTFGNCCGNGHYLCQECDCMFEEDEENE